MLVLSASPFLGAWKYNNKPSDAKASSNQPDGSIAPQQQFSEVNNQPLLQEILVLRDVNNGGSINLKA